MNEIIRKTIAVIVALVLCIGFGTVLMMYSTPMENDSLDLSLVPSVENADPAAYSDKGWSVFTQNGELKTALEPDGLGGFPGISSGQTFYYSRVMEEEMISPMLQIEAADSTFAVWLDSTLLYADCVDLDNQVGRLTLPMSTWHRSEPITVELPADYQGKTLTIAQSYPVKEATAEEPLKAYPADVSMYGGYVHESGLISETFGAAASAAVLFAAGIFLLIILIMGKSKGLLWMALAFFLWMAAELAGVSFFGKYFAEYSNLPVAAVGLFGAAAMLIFLSVRSGKLGGLLWLLTVGYILSACAYTAMQIIFPKFNTEDLISNLIAQLPQLFAFAALIIAIFLGLILWRKDSWFYRIFAPVALAAEAVYWIGFTLITGGGEVMECIKADVHNYSVSYIYQHALPAVAIAILIAAAAEAVKNENERRTERQELEFNRKMTQTGCENMKLRYEETEKLRQEMNSHYLALKEMSGEENVKAHLDELIAQNEAAAPAIKSGNRMIDMVLNSRLGAVSEAGIRAEIGNLHIPEKLPYTDEELYILMTNLIDGAVADAGESVSDEKFLRLHIDIENEFITFLCENSAVDKKTRRMRRKESSSEKNRRFDEMQSIADSNEGVFDNVYIEDLHRVRVSLPL